MKSEDDANTARERIRREENNFAEATVYRLDNAYLNREEKLEVELWFQFPGKCALLAFLACSIWSVYQPIGWKLLLAIPCLVNLVIGLFNWYFYSQRALWLLYLTILHNFALWVFTLVASALLVIHKHYLLAVIVILGNAILVPFCLIHMAVYVLLSRISGYEMNPKYVFFKRFYAYRFPFEEEA